MPNDKFGKNVVILGASMKLSVYVDNKKKIVILGKGLTQGLDGTTFTAEAEYSINFTEHGKMLF